MAGEAEDLEVIDLPDGKAAPEGQSDAVDTREPAEGASEAPDPVTAAAIKAGWKPKDQWKGDTTNWTDAGDFLAGLATQNKSLKDQVKRTTSVAERAIEVSRRRAIEEAQRMIAEAAEAGDPEAAIRGAQQLEQASSIGSTPRDEFKSKNAWFDDDPAATAVAIAEAQKIADAGGSVKEQFAAAEKEVRKRFPEHFDDAEPTTPPVRSAPHVQSGTRTPAPPRKKGWADMPAHARDMNEKAFVRKGLMTREELADAYWQENG